MLGKDTFLGIRTCILQDGELVSDSTDEQKVSVIESLGFHICIIKRKTGSCPCGIDPTVFFLLGSIHILYHLLYYTKVATTLQLVL